MSTGFILGWCVIWGLIGLAMGSGRPGIGSGVGAFLGVLLGPIGLLIIATSKTAERRNQRRSWTASNAPPTHRVGTLTRSAGSLPDGGTGNGGPSTSAVSKPMGAAPSSRIRSRCSLS